MLVVLTDGQFPVLKCPWCNTAFHGPETEAWIRGHVAVCELRAIEFGCAKTMPVKNYRLAAGRFYARLGG